MNKQILATFKNENGDCIVFKKNNEYYLTDNNITTKITLLSINSEPLKYDLWISTKDNEIMYFNE